jgi:hypothetical protein
MFGGQLSERASATGDAVALGGLVGTTTTTVGGGAGGEEHAGSRSTHAASGNRAELRAFEEQAVTGSEGSAFHA